MIMYVVVNLPKTYENGGQGYHTTKLRLERASGQPCLVQYFADVSTEMIRDLGVKAMVLSGFGPGFAEFDVRDLLRFGKVVKPCPVPTLAICGSHQLVGSLFNNELRLGRKTKSPLPMRRLGRGEVELSVGDKPGFFRELGYYRVRILRRDPIFEEFKGSLVVRESHYCEIKRLPRGFTLLATSPGCRIQAMRHESLPLRAVQFHPEGYTDYYPDGKRLLENFFQWAKTIAS